MVNITDLRSPSFAEARILRYQMQAVARHMLPETRLKICLRYQREKYGNVDIFKHRQTQKAFYGGLMVCGSTWVCPVCAAKISERRRSELKHASEAHKQAGGHLTMLTLTFSHKKVDKLSELLEKLEKAMLKFSSGKRANQLRQMIGQIGRVRALELTYGENGWHPHIHMLIFHNNEIEGFERELWEEKYYDLWSKSCEKVGLTCSREHGVKLDDATEADQYIGKWGDLVESKWQIDSEMTKAHIKKGRVDNLTPFDFLRIAVEDGDLEYMPQFKEYAKSMKGKTQLKWSRGLKDAFSIEDKTDEQIAESKEEPADLLGSLDWKEWQLFTNNDQLRAQLLNWVEQYGYEDALKKAGIKRKISTEIEISKGKKPIEPSATGEALR